MCVQLEARRRISEKSPTSPSENRHQPGFRNTALMAWLPFAKSSVTVFKTNIYYIKSSEMKWLTNIGIWTFRCASVKELGQEPDFALLCTRVSGPLWCLHQPGRSWQGNSKPTNASRPATKSKGMKPAREQTNKDRMSLGVTNLYRVRQRRSTRNLTTHYSLMYPRSAQSPTKSLRTLHKLDTY